ncbi:MULTISPECIES: type II toxin-antitoxin system VapC family toxin [unclassified Pseudomonas]|uniref:type II toxin-antitoxin system VapC family toxin n=1 Tax=unclassified Pseudomonas TaxID=196821 RepID=UPI00209B7598|nr:MULTISPECIES: type II toxin-antitoxin system VapC family toxin [unclassified Pseudomonas]
MSLIYISDTNIWIDFRNAGLLEHMFRLPFTLCCTDFVMHELEDFAHDELLAQGLVVESFDERGVQKLWALKIAHNNSALADVSCYLLAQITGRPLLTGDGKLRRQAIQDGLQVHGALWLLDLYGRASSHQLWRRSDGARHHVSGRLSLARIRMPSPTVYLASEPS